jgi:hypothetical protein
MYLVYQKIKIKSPVLIKDSLLYHSFLRKQLVEGQTYVIRFDFKVFPQAWNINPYRHGRKKKKKNKWGQIKRITLKRVKILRERLEKIFFAGAGTLASPLASATAYRLRLIVTFLGGEGRRRSKYSIINKDIKSMLEKEEGMLAKIIEKKNKAKQS